MNEHEIKHYKALWGEFSEEIKHTFRSLMRMKRPFVNQFNDIHIERFKARHLINIDAKERVVLADKGHKLFEYLKLAGQLVEDQS